jgi:hypothetical protein
MKVMDFNCQFPGNAKNANNTGNAKNANLSVQQELSNFQLQQQVQPGSGGPLGSPLAAAILKPSFDLEADRKLQEVVEDGWFCCRLLLASVPGVAVPQ